MKYRRIPVEVEALCWKQDNLEEIRAMLQGKARARRSPLDNGLWIEVEGMPCLTVYPGEYVLVSEQGHIGSAGPFVFENTFEPI
jgi:hypothetical protein